MVRLLGGKFLNNGDLDEDRYRGNSPYFTVLEFFDALPEEFLDYLCFENTAFVQADADL